MPVREKKISPEESIRLKSRVSRLYHCNKLSIPEIAQGMGMGLATIHKYVKEIEAEMEKERDKKEITTFYNKQIMHWENVLEMSYAEVVACDPGTSAKSIAIRTLANNIDGYGKFLMSTGHISTAPMKVELKAEITKEPVNEEALRCAAEAVLGRFQTVSSGRRTPPERRDVGDAISKN